MRFGIRNLLWITGGVYVYAAAVGSSLSEDRVRWMSLSDLAGSVLIAAIIAAFVLRSRRAAGKLLLASRRPYAVWAHGVLMGSYVTVMLAASGRSGFPVEGLLGTAFYHAMVEAYTSIVITERGVYSDMKLRRWDQGKRMKSPSGSARLFASGLPE